jgi:hypothetical protein
MLVRYQAALMPDIKIFGPLRTAPAASAAAAQYNRPPRGFNA